MTEINMSQNANIQSLLLAVGQHGGCKVVVRNFGAVTVEGEKVTFHSKATVTEIDVGQGRENLLENSRRTRVGRQIQSHRRCWGCSRQSS